MDIKKLYCELKNAYNVGELMFFLDVFTKDNSIDSLNFHYSLLKDRDNINLFYHIRAAFKKRKKIGIDFLLKKIETEQDEILKSEAIFILGLMRCHEIKKDTVNLYLTTNNYSVKYNCIVVLGWLGSTLKDIYFLSDIMNNTSENSNLRAYAASAVRQIWYENNTLSIEILYAYKRILNNNNNDYVIDSTIIACIQDMLKKKFGISESRYGEISGDVEKSKLKAINAIDKYLNDK